MGLGGLGMWEMIMIFLVVLLLFGAKRLPEIGSSLGKGIREFKGSIREIEKEVKAVDEEPARGAVPSPPDSPGESDEGPRRLTTSPGPSSGQSHPGGVPTREEAPQSGVEGAGPEPERSEPEGSEPGASGPEGSDVVGSEEEAPTG